MTARFDMLLPNSLRQRSLFKQGLLVAMCSLAAACSSTVDGNGNGNGGNDDGFQDGPDAGFNPGGGADAQPQNPSADSDEDGVIDDLDNCPRLANPGQEDGDADEVGDACDCAPNDGGNDAVLVLKDSLATDAGMFAATPGFNAANWTFQNGGYRQTRLVNNSTDGSLFQGLEMSDVYMKVTSQSTEIADFGADDLRQLFLVARVQADGNAYDAIGCGLEVVEGLSPTTKTTTLNFAGTPPNGINHEIFQRTNRGSLQVNQDATIEMTLRGSNLSCNVTVGGVTTSASATVPAGSGYVGVHTRETKALFKNMTICEFQK